MDALLGGAVGILIGTGLFAHFYPAINEKILSIGQFPVETIPECIHLPRWIVVLVFVAGLSGVLWFLQIQGL